MYKRVLCFFTACGLLTGCAPFMPVDSERERISTPRQIAASGKPSSVKTVQWGGVIVNVSNLHEATEIEVISYPLQRNEMPDTDEAPQGRFIAVNNGYLEPLDYYKGRRVTLQGQVKQLRPGTVGDAGYLFPLLQVERIRLWPKPGSGLSPFVNFGIGVGSGGRSGGSIGVGIGF